MNDSRSRFERWILSVNANDGHTIERIEPGEYRSAATDCAWDAWQAAEAETARRCAELIKTAIARWPMESHYSAGTALDCIRKEFPEAFK